MGSVASSLPLVSSKLKVWTGERKSSALARGVLIVDFGGVMSGLKLDFTLALALVFADFWAVDDLGVLEALEDLGAVDGLDVAEDLVDFLVGVFLVDLGVGEDCVTFLERRETKPSIDLF